MTTPYLTRPLRTEKEARRQAIRDRLALLWEYFDNRADADHNGFMFVGNEEMRLLDDVEELMKLTEAYDAPDNS